MFSRENSRYPFFFFFFFNLVVNYLVYDILSIFGLSSP